MAPLRWFRIALLVVAAIVVARAEVLTPPQFDLAKGKEIRATATCGMEEHNGVEVPFHEFYCYLGGADTEKDHGVEILNGQSCDVCDMGKPEKWHPASNAIDGAETWWMSPPLSRGAKFNEVNLTIDLGREFHVIYIFIKMAISPRPGVWALERSTDNGKTFRPWQYFAGSSNECWEHFGISATNKIESDDSVICVTDFSKVTPIRKGEIVIKLTESRPSAKDFHNSTELQEWTKATNVRLRLLRTKTFLGDLMSLGPHDPTVTRRYFYAIKDISIGGSCVCNGHADECSETDPDKPYKLFCKCRHNTCGTNCERCCEGYVQKPWRLSKTYDPFICEPCNCFGHSDKCEYDAKVDKHRKSLDIYGNYNGGGVCKYCKHNTDGINCNKCKPGFYRLKGIPLNATNICSPCKCDKKHTTGNCADETGLCECKPEFNPPDCKSCRAGYYGYPKCHECECNSSRTVGKHCHPDGGQCICKPNYSGRVCNICADGYYDFPNCLPCKCNSDGALNKTCNKDTGGCFCKKNFTGQTCDKCRVGFYGFPNCEKCQCHKRGTQPDICHRKSGACICKAGYRGRTCEQCSEDKYNFPKCIPCGCSRHGSSSQACRDSGECRCHPNYAGSKCDKCNAGYYQYPDCLDCKCNLNGSYGISCDNEGICQCRSNFTGIHCDKCKQGFFNFPTCEACNCDPKGVMESNSGCESLPTGELCPCKKHVRGRICNECKPHYWNIQASNPDGCEGCECYLPGVVGGIGECSQMTGQCNCKFLVESRKCEECRNGTFNLTEDNMLGCSDCGCDVGGSVNDICEKETGQCLCKPNIEGRTCGEPIDGYYFPSLYQLQFEAEDGRTPNYDSIHYEFDQNLFYNFSWKGYAVFSHLQNEIILNIEVKRTSIYRMVFHYVNPNNDPVLVNVTIVPSNLTDTEQTFEALLKPSKTPSFTTVADRSGNVPPSLIMNSGEWSIRIKNEKQLFLDYVVIIPSAFYQPNSLSKRINTPCTVGEDKKEKNNFCRHFDYLSISRFDIVQGKSLSKSGSKSSAGIYIPALFSQREKSTDEDKPELQMKLQLSKTGYYVLMIIYINPADDGQTSQISVEATPTKGTSKWKATLYPCNYNAFCRQVVQDEHGKIGLFKFNTKSITLLLKGNEKSKIDIKSVVAIPYDEWSFDYIKPKSVCVKKDGKCLPDIFTPPQNSMKVEFEAGSKAKKSKVLPKGITDKNIGLINLSLSDKLIEVKGRVLHRGKYVLVIHYYQPNTPGFVLDAMIHNGHIHEAYLNIQHCLSQSGCRSTVHEAAGNIQLKLTDDFLLTLKKHDNTTVWLDYVMVIPAEWYSENILYEDNVDQTGQFIHECGKNEFYIRSDVQGFCRNSVFSITSNYNNGTLPCHCDADGSLSSSCEKFGGQCPCKANIIGRKCDHCKSGHYGFPYCKPCNCPSKLPCDSKTGACICPPRTTGKKCDKCENLSYGYDESFGCKECNCNLQGVEEGSLQCDLITGSCKCKENIEGRTCEHCSPGHSSFPFCNACTCDLRGTMPNICDEFSSECICKKNVIGKACNTCMEGTFNIEKKNTDGCMKCFCFGRTNNCTSSSLYKSKVSGMRDWNLAEVKLKEIREETINISLSISEDSVHANLTSKDVANKVVYFVAPELYLGNKLTSYGGFLNYTIRYSTHRYSDVTKADVIFYGSNMYLLHSLKNKSTTQNQKVSLNIMETNFNLPNGFSVTRKEVLEVLQDLKGLYIRATYSLPSSYAKLENVILETAEEFNDLKAERALLVEQCSCPENYRGLSCEKCAPGFFRFKAGSRDECIPCQCNRHSNMCDPLTGVCLNCKHETTGDNCEKCEKGYYGNATHGSHLDCKRCACPHPTLTNNFALECEVSTDGKNIKCDCQPQYTGNRCETCAAGYYGRPDVKGGRCKPCQCSGNINPKEHGTCHPTTGVCLKCLNNTFGKDCSLCAPGFFGDAVNLKNCQKCKCEKCGTDSCDSRTGQCKCKMNVDGDKCDRCAPNYWNFQPCEGCKHCDCQLASKSMQCDVKTGKCTCRHGVTGLKCDRCIDGYWNYSSTGCIPCGCNAQYSDGSTCDAETGQCRCLLGLKGKKCDYCPDRWVFVDEKGCIECDLCIHILLNETDSLAEMVRYVTSDFNDVAVGYHTIQRLIYLNSTVIELCSKVKLLIPRPYDITPMVYQVERLKDASRKTKRMSLNVLERSTKTEKDGNAIQAEAFKVEKEINADIEHAKNTVMEMSGFNFHILDSGSKIESALSEAQDILKQIKNKNLRTYKENAISELEKSQEYLNKVQDFLHPVMNHTQTFEILHTEVATIDNKLEDLFRHNRRAKDNIEKAISLINHNRYSQLNQKIETLMNMSKYANSALEEASSYRKNSSEILEELKTDIEHLSKNDEELVKITNQINTSMEAREKGLKDNKEHVKMAVDHAEELDKKAQELNSLFADTRNASENATTAANSYKNIVAAIEEAMTAAQDAEKTDNETMTMSKNFSDLTGKSAKRASELLRDSKDSLNRTQTLLAPYLEKEKKRLKGVIELNQNSESEEKKFNSILQNIPTEMVKSLAKNASKTSKEASRNSEATIHNISDIAERSPEDLIEAKEISKIIDDINVKISHSRIQVEKVKLQVPEVANLENQIEKKQTSINDRLAGIEKKIATLKEIISSAQDKIKRIEVGVKMQGNSTLELKNPEGLSLLGTSAKISTYFRTNERNGFLLYLGNEMGTKNRLNRVVTDDFMAIEIENGIPILKIDLGSGPESIVSDKEVSDNNWYQVIVERFGKNVKLIIREESEDGINLHEKEVVLPGNHAILNLDQDLSKLFVGSYPPLFKMQSAVKYSSFTGELEGLLVEDIPVSLWDFNKAEYVKDAKERDKFINLQPKTGFRFDGNSFVVMNWTTYQMKQKCLIQLRFKTYAKDGLLFLVEKDNSFLSIELANGFLVYQYDLGDGMATLKSDRLYNDGDWHNVEAVRQKNEALLKIDGKDIDKGSSPGKAIYLVISELMYFGGYPGQHNLTNVTNHGFDGCIDHVHIGRTPINLIENTKDFRVIPGCPTKTTRIASFLENGEEYIKLPNIKAEEFLQIIFKFNTKQENSLLFYATDSSQANSVSLSLINGALIMYGPKKKIRVSTAKTNLTRYNDGKWHVVTATYDSNVMHLHIDDFYSFGSKVHNVPLKIKAGDLYFGGVPNDYDIMYTAAPDQTPFVGCLGDASINGKVIKFAELTKSPHIVIGKCYSSRQEYVKPTGLSEKLLQLPQRDSRCLLPMNPSIDINITASNGYRFGTKPHSHLEYSEQNIHVKRNISIEFNTKERNGIIFYTANDKQTDFTTLFLKDGKMNYAFRCESTATVITTAEAWNDGQWHLVEFTRHKSGAKLFIDHLLVKEDGTTCKRLKITNPIFVGGIPTKFRTDSLKNLMGQMNSFSGCLRNFLISGNMPLEPNDAQGVVPCSENVEPGVFFHSGGGYLRIANEFKVGTNIIIAMDVKPRKLDGLLISVHGKRDFLVLQMYSGKILFIVNNGKGSISTEYNPADRDLLCDGNWHHIKVTKNKNVAILQVDGEQRDMKIGSNGASSTDTSNPLYLGGHAHINSRLHGVKTREPYIGCIRNMSINTNPIKLTDSKSVGNVTIGVCPTI